MTPFCDGTDPRLDLEWVRLCAGDFRAGMVDEEEVIRLTDGCGVTLDEVLRAAT